MCVIDCRLGPRQTYVIVSFIFFEIFLKIICVIDFRLGFVFNLYGNIFNNKYKEFVQYNNNTYSSVLHRHKVLME